MRLTVDAPPETVLAVARIIARDRQPWGALESDDFVSAACLCFYRTRDRVQQRARDFHNFMVRSMATAMREQTRGEARQYGYDRPQRTPLVVQGLASKTRVVAGGGSASPLTETARYRRRAARSEHNKTYYYRTVGLQACEVCGEHALRGHGARRCTAHAITNAEYCRLWRERRKAQQSTQEGTKVA